MKTLRQAAIGDTVKVVKLHGEGAVKRRIMDMGLTRGVEVYVRKAGVCTCHAIREKALTEAVLAKVREICERYLSADELLPTASKAVEDAQKADNPESEAQALQSKIESLTAHLDKMYMDKLSGILDGADFERVYLKLKAERAALEEKLSALERPDYSPEQREEKAKALVRRFVDSASTNRELLVSLVERVELGEDKQIIIKFRFGQLEKAG